MDNSTITTLAIATLVNAIMTYLQRAEWAPWITENTERVNRTLSILLSFLLTAGIVLQCSGSSTTGWDCTARIPPVAQLWEFFIRSLAAFGTSKGLHKLNGVGRS